MSASDPPSPNSRLRPEVIAAWTEALVSAEVRSIQAEFREHGARGPKVTWNPPPESLEHAPLRFLLEHWRNLAGDRQMPLAGQIDALTLRPALGFLSLLHRRRRRFPLSLVRHDPLGRL